MADWQAMVDGQLLRPVPGTFGPGVVSPPIKTGFFDLGFAEPLAVQAGEHIKGLVPGSPAALCEGDELAETVGYRPHLR